MLFRSKAAKKAAKKAADKKKAYEVERMAAKKAVKEAAKEAADKKKAYEVEILAAKKAVKEAIRKAADNKRAYEASRMAAKKAAEKAADNKRAYEASRMAAKKAAEKSADNKMAYKAAENKRTYEAVKQNAEKKHKMSDHDQAISKLGSIDANSQGFVYARKVPKYPASRSLIGTLTSTRSLLEDFLTNIKSFVNFNSDAEVVLPKQDNMFSSFDGAKGTTLDQLSGTSQPMNLAVMFP